MEPDNDFICKFMFSEYSFKEENEQTWKIDLYSLRPKKNANSVDGTDFVADTMHLLETDNKL